MPPSYNYLPNFSAPLATIPPDTIVSRTLYTDQQLKIMLFGFASGQELSEHTSARQATLHFLQGVARLTLGEDSIIAEAGTYVVMPPHLPHSIVAETPVVMLLTMIDGGAAAHAKAQAVE